MYMYIYIYIYVYVYIYIWHGEMGVLLANLRTRN